MKPQLRTWATSGIAPTPPAKLGQQHDLWREPLECALLVEDVEVVEAAAHAGVARMSVAVEEKVRNSANSPRKPEYTSSVASVAASGR